MTETARAFAFLPRQCEEWSHSGPAVKIYRHRSLSGGDRGSNRCKFKLERPAIFEYIASGAGIAHFLLGLIIFDAALGSWVTEQWIDAKRGRLGYGHSLVARILAAAQPIVHASFMVFTLTTVVARTEGFYNELWIARAEADIQEAVEQFRVNNKRYPTSFDELEPRKPYLASVVAKLKGEHFEYHKVGDDDYQLTFKRAERGAGDDRIVTHESIAPYN